MSVENSKTRFACEPLTPPGVAAFAKTSVRRLWFVQLIFALFAATIIVWFVKTAWFPIVSSAVRELPTQGEIHNGKLDWPANSPQLLADGNFLAIMVDLEHEGQVRSPAHVQVEFGRNEVYFFSLLGYRQVPYPPESDFAFNRTDLEPKWGAWRPPILWLTFGAVVAGLMANWAMLATIYFPVVWLVGFFANKDLDFRASWKLAGAALMPGALLLTLAIFVYGLGGMDPVQLTAAFVAHFVIGWIYLIAAPLFASKLEASGAVTKNPFVEPTPTKGPENSNSFKEP